MNNNDKNLYEGLNDLGEVGVLFFDEEGNMVVGNLGNPNK